MPVLKDFSITKIILKNCINRNIFVGFICLTQVMYYVQFYLRVQVW